ncbi:hypothetical protein J6590_079558 [Homalodisca vitripennis]|nr:hypothetical protein J6590_079558 [Homalodisca vitripennis]
MSLPPSPTPTAENVVCRKLMYSARASWAGGTHTALLRPSSCASHVTPGLLTSRKVAPAAPATLRAGMCLSVCLSARAHARLSAIMSLIARPPLHTPPPTQAGGLCQSLRAGQRAEKLPIKDGPLRVMTLVQLLQREGEIADVVVWGEGGSNCEIHHLLSVTSSLLSTNRLVTGTPDLTLARLSPRGTATPHIMYSPSPPHSSDRYRVSASGETGSSQVQCPARCTISWGSLVFTLLLVISQRLFTLLLVIS